MAKPTRIPKRTGKVVKPPPEAMADVGVTAPGPNSIDVNELISIIGTKDVEIYLLRRQLGAHQQALQAAQAQIAELMGQEPEAKEGAEG